MPFDPKDRAVLTIRGQDYQEWESVQVKHTLANAPFYTFRMTCSEGQPIASNFKTMQIVPADRATITLGGQPAFSGLVYSRQVFYDATKHYIEIQGASNVLQLSYAHVVHKTMEFNNKSAKQIIDELVQPHGINFKEEGGSLPSKPIERFSVAPGTTVMDAVEQVLRKTGGAQLTSDLQNDLVAVIDAEEVQGTVREGVDILEGREIIFNPSIYQGIFVTGQKPGNDQEWGAAAAQMQQQNSGQSTGGQGNQVIPMEGPSFSTEMLQNRGNMDREFQSRDQVTVFVTLRGWLRPGGGLWERSPKKLSVISPMLIMDGSENLFVKSVTFTQDNTTGTRTVLECCNKLAWAPVPQGGP